VTTFFTIDRANERIPEVRELLLLLRGQRRELIELRDRYVALPDAEPDAADSEDRAAERGGREATTGAGGAGSPHAPTGGAARGDAPLDEGATLTGLEQAELIRLRIKGIVDQMGASVARLDGWGITLRDIETGLIDFPALVDGRQVWLCWKLGEGDVEWWHELDSGFAGRRPLAELGSGRGVH
jgi:hypothetical protein